jgi:ABC-type Fe3+/spermidine/putrescine transport system ATPase subunit
VQTGTPEQIYTEPATPFVARFTGLAGEMRVQVRGHGAGGQVEVSAAGEGGRPITARAMPDDRLRPGDEALLLIRPTGVVLCATTDNDHHVTGSVTDVAFRGRGYEHAVDVPGHGRLTGVFATHRTARGDRVGLRFHPAGCHLFHVTDVPAPAPLPVP